ncbi:MAG: pyridoxamine 5'-phosphate oxidase family protein [Gammaproteobacteria bacterium]|nr:pyridoxamine 5'-phosphate oxidase family protein [Gammaproteobacteria bacterium]
MGKEYTEIDPKIQSWIDRQHMFFVSTAPLSSDGLLNCSPKGLDSLRVLGARKMAYLDVGGSGIETVAHLKENGRIVIMMCAFSGPPKIFRFYGRGSVIEPQQAGFDELLQEFPALPAARNIIVIDVERIIDSCGYGVPLYEFQADRDSMRNHYDSKTVAEVLSYRAERNSRSLDGLPGLLSSDQ